MWFDCYVHRLNNKSIVMCVLFSVEQPLVIRLLYLLFVSVILLVKVDSVTVLGASKVWSFSTVTIVINVAFDWLYNRAYTNVLCPVLSAEPTIMLKELLHCRTELTVTEFTEMLSFSFFFVCNLDLFLRCAVLPFYVVSVKWCRMRFCTDLTNTFLCALFFTNVPF